MWTKYEYNEGLCWISLFPRLPTLGGDFYYNVELLLVCSVKLLEIK